MQDRSCRCERAFRGRESSTHNAIVPDRHNDAGIINETSATNLGQAWSEDRLVRPLVLVYIAYNPSVPRHERVSPFTRKILTIGRL